jgi:hypothetical protein
MSFSVRFTCAALVGGGLLGLGCGDSGAPVGPKTLTAVAGDGQFWMVSAPLPAPLRVRVIGTDDQPLAGATVTWGVVVAGSATVSPPSSTTDSLGMAATTVTLGATPGPVAVRATVATLQQVVFNVAACAVSAFTLGATLTAALATSDCRANGFYTDVYSLDLTSGGGPQGLTIFDSAATFDAYLEFYRGDGVFLAVNDDIEKGVIKNSLLHVIAAPGSYIIAPSAFDPDTTGPYTLSAVSWTPALAGCAEVWVTRGISVADSVTTTDCAAPGPFYADAVSIVAAAGSVLTIAERSTAFDAFLELYLDLGADQNLVFIAGNNDSAGVGPDAFLVATVPQTARYIVFAATADAGRTGAYTLTVSASTTLSGSAFAPLRMPKGLPRRAWSR